MAWKWKLHIISIHAPTRGATPYGLLTANVRLFQSTLLQEERLAETLRSGESTVISIHAPTRGATLSILRVSFSSKDFNPRSYKRSDLVNFAAFSVTIIFQSTLLQEERLFVHYFWCKYKISIHAPTRGATWMVSKFSVFIRISIHAPTRGATLKWVMVSQSFLFQSTLLQEERR